MEPEGKLEEPDPQAWMKRQKVIQIENPILSSDENSKDIDYTEDVMGYLKFNEIQVTPLLNNNNNTRGVNIKCNLQNLKNKQKFSKGFQMKDKERQKWIKTKQANTEAQRNDDIEHINLDQPGPSGYNNNGNDASVIPAQADITEEASNQNLSNNIVQQTPGLEPLVPESNAIMNYTNYYNGYPYRHIGGGPVRLQVGINSYCNIPSCPSYGVTTVQHYFYFYPANPVWCLHSMPRL